MYSKSAINFNLKHMNNPESKGNYHHIMGTSEENKGENLEGSAETLREALAEFDAFKKKFADYDERRQQVAPLVDGNDYINVNILRNFSSGHRQLENLKAELDGMVGDVKDPDSFKIKVRQAADWLTGMMGTLENIEAQTGMENKTRQLNLQTIEEQFAGYQTEYDQVKNDPSLTDKERNFIDTACKSLLNDIESIKGMLQSPSRKTFNRAVEGMAGSFENAWQNMRHVQRIIAEKS